MKTATTLTLEDIADDLIIMDGISGIRSNLTDGEMACILEEIRSMGLEEAVIESVINNYLTQ